MFMNYEFDSFKDLYNLLKFIVTKYFVPIEHSII